MSAPVRITAAWRRDHPLPSGAAGGDKESRGRVLVIGGSRLTPGAPRLAAEAALRVGAGKVRIGTVESAAVALGLLVPEAGVVGLPEHEAGGIAGLAPLKASLAGARSVLIGPGMQRGDDLPTLVRDAINQVSEDAALVLDSGAMSARIEGGLGRALVLTPHPGELATLTGDNVEAIRGDLAGHAARAADRFGAVVVMKSGETLIAAPGEPVLVYENDAVGLGTAGSGDVLGGVVAGLLARGTEPRLAAAWGVWLHGEAGQGAALANGPLGFLARDLLPLLPRVLALQG